MTGDDRAAPPFETWPVQLWARDIGLRIWYAEPAVFVTQISTKVARLPQAQMIGQAMDHVLRRFRQQVDMHHGLLVIHDWRSVEVFEADANSYYTHRISGYQRGEQRGASIALKANPFVRGMLQLGAIAMPFRTGHPVSFIQDPLSLLAVHAVVPINGDPFRDLVRL